MAASSTLDEMAEPRYRKAVRAVLLDADDRIFLVQFKLPHATFWATPGGGMEEGETEREALHRELHEEVGTGNFAIGPHIWTSTRLWPQGRQLSTGYDGQINAIFLAHVDGSTLGASLLSAEELRQEAVVDRAWWTMAELQGARTEFSPDRLPALVADLLITGPPAAPIDVSY